MAKKKIFEKVGVANANMRKRCDDLRIMIDGVNASELMRLSKDKYGSSFKKYMETNFSTVICNDYSTVTRDEPDSLARRFIIHGKQSIKMTTMTTMVDGIN